MPVLAYLLARFSEPSSYAGLGALLALLGWNLPDGVIGQLVQLLAGFCGLLALCLKERGMIRAIVLVFAVVPALSGCAGGLGAVDGITEAASPYIAAACGEYEKAKAAADAAIAAGAVPAAVSGKVSSIERFGDAACATPPSGDPLSTAIWLGQIAGQIATLTTTAH